MKVFITGATGFIGCAIVNELLTSGHKILGLARSERSTITLQPIGAEVHKGNLEDLQSIRNAAAKSDAIIHCAYRSDFSKIEQNNHTEALAINALSMRTLGWDPTGPKLIEDLKNMKYL